MGVPKKHQRLGFEVVTLCFGALTLVLLALPAIAWLRHPELHVFRDFHEHVAVVKALSLDLLHPAHPMLRDPLPHGWFSPYAWIVAVLCRVFGCEPARALLGMGVLNALIVISGVVAFLRSIGERRSGVWALALLILFFGWSPKAPLWSGFLNVRMHSVVASYPATFAIGLGWWLLAGVNAVSRASGLSLLGVGLGFLWLIHPSTAMSVTVGGVGLFLLNSWGLLSQPTIEPFVRKSVRSFLWIVPWVVGLCLLWPLYPWVELVGGDRAHFNHDSRLLYQNVSSWLLPLGAGLPVLLFRLGRDHRDPLCWLGGLWFLIYITGGMTGAFGMGRSVAFAVMALQMAVASELPRLFSRFYTGAGAIRSRGVRGALRAALILVCVAVAILPVRLGWRLAIHPRLADPAESLDFLKDYVESNDLILSDLLTSFRVPAVQGKILASFHPLYFIPDHDQRREQLQRIFSGRISESQFREFLQASQARFVLIPLRRVTPLTGSLLRGAGRLVHQTSRYQLIEVPRQAL